ncbi:MAG: hypothetical protein KBE65_21140 [Phycisphaerae bacterium]|nr:hypothetical protein [Phycisphaerae bacterium]
MTRPFKISGNMTLVLDLTTMAWEMEDWGQATHMGRHANEGSGLATDPTLADGTGSGVNTVASGDQVFWDIVADGGVWTVTFTGGTGRFAGATGSFIAVPSGMVVATGQGSAQLTYTLAYTGNGTITY